MKLKQLLLKGGIQLTHGTTCGSLNAGEKPDGKTNDRSYGWTLMPGPHWVEATDRDGRKWLVPWSMVNNPPEVLQEEQAAPEDPRADLLAAMVDGAVAGATAAKKKGKAA